jgi:hypothetical protein
MNKFSVVFITLVGICLSVIIGSIDGWMLGSLFGVTVTAVGLLTYFFVGG